MLFIFFCVFVSCSEGEPDDAVKRTEESKIDFAKESIHNDQTKFSGAILTDDSGGSGGGRNILSLLLEKGERLKDDMVQSQIQNRPRYRVLKYCFFQECIL